MGKTKEAIDNEGQTSDNEGQRKFKNFLNPLSTNLILSKEKILEFSRLPTNIISFFS